MIFVKVLTISKTRNNFQHILGTTVFCPEVKSILFWNWIVRLGWNFWSLLTGKPGSGIHWNRTTGLLMSRPYSNRRDRWFVANEQQSYDLFWQNFLNCGTNKITNAQPLICKYHWLPPVFKKLPTFYTSVIVLQSNALSFYRSQNVLCRSKFFEPAQNFDCI